MEDEHHYELRSNSRSRSQTPQVLNRTVLDLEPTEHHYDLRNKSRERSHTPGEVTSSRRSSSRSLPASSIKLREINMDTITEQIAEKNIESEEKLPDNSTFKKMERRSDRHRVKRQIFANVQSEINENALNDKIEVERKSESPRRIMTSDYLSEDGDREDHPSRPGSAYEIYKKAGEWWNVFPKTDYTYSRASQCRYEIAPGVLAMPNMSRRSIHSDCSSTHGSSISNSQQSLNQESLDNNDRDITDMKLKKQNNRSMDDTYSLLRTCNPESAGKSILFKRTHVEEYVSHREVVYGSNILSPIEADNKRYKENNSLSSRKYGYIRQTNFDTESNEEIIRSTYVNRNSRMRISEIFPRIFSVFTTLSNTVSHIVSSQLFRKKETFTSHDYQQYHESKWSQSWEIADHLLQYLYLLFVKVLFLDSWILSRASNVRNIMNGRRSNVLWIIFLPLILTAGFWFLPSFSSTVPFLVASSSEKATSFSNESTLRKEGYIVENSRYEELRSVVKILSDKVEQLGNKDISQDEHLANVTRVVQDLKKGDENIWSEYDTKLVRLEESLRQDMNHKCHDIFDTIKIEFQALRENYSQLKFCCDTNPRALTDEEIENHIDRVLSGYFGSSVSKEELLRVIQSSLMIQDNAEIRKESVQVGIPMKGDVFPEEMRKIVKEFLKIYDADKTGIVDYALESAGGQVISTRCTQRYNVKTRAYKLLGLTLYYESNNPRTVIQGNALQPGACWAFQDFPGYLLIKLRNLIYVTGFTLEHVPKSILPNGDMRSAPRKFNVWGLKDENDPEPVMFGEYEFIDSDENLQYFPVQNTSIKTSYEYVEFRIHSNHGHLEYTCLYRFRVHGQFI